MAHRLPEVRAPEPTLRFLPRGTALVQDYRALLETGTNRFHGWQWDGSLGPEFKDTITGQTMRHGGRVKLVDVVVTVLPGDPHRKEYIQHAKDGDFWVADEVTAAACDVPLEAHFLDEHPETAAALKPKAVESKPALVSLESQPDK
jgi:hypothetical protein